MNRRVALAILALPAALLIQAAVAQAPTAAQPELPKEKLVIVTKDGQQHPFNVEMGNHAGAAGDRADVPPERAGGWRHCCSTGAGVRDSTMWMRNTIAPLDMLFINPDGSIRHIAENTVPESLAIIPSGGNVRATLELAAGTAARLHIRVGDKVEQRIFGNLPQG